MPRRGKGSKIGGQPNGVMPKVAPTQPVQTPTGLPYGQAGQLAAAQQAVPLADLRAQMMEQAKQWDPGEGITPLSAPSMRPTEPLTAGLASGPGPGPAVLPPRARTFRVADVLGVLAESTGDPMLAELARRAGNQGV